MGGVTARILKGCAFSVVVLFNSMVVTLLWNFNPPFGLSRLAYLDVVQLVLVLTMALVPYEAYRRMFLGSTRKIERP